MLQATDNYNHISWSLREGGSAADTFLVSTFLGFEGIPVWSF